MRRRNDLVSAPDNSKAIDAAWRIHAAQIDWTGKVDAKAAFAFAIESAALATVIGLSAPGRLFSELGNGFLLTLYYTGLFGLLVSIAFAALVVFPRLRGRHTKAESADNFIYFGHARHWEATVLKTALAEVDLLDQLSRQIVVMATIAWTKHKRVQWSVSSAVAAAALLVICATFVRNH
ncbi:DUF5706 domain-containing protein [Brevibacterium sp. K11IcPPYGO002]|uniref:Pycsar system effector family protein n=1 Tax=Brevibacterium sp. K11IcPPYGO002 TaxID=3058837 RepID=UPI003D818E94